MQKKEKGILTLPRVLLAVMIVLAITGAVLFQAETKVSMKSTAKILQERIASIEWAFGKAEEETNAFRDGYDSFQQAKADSIAMYLDQRRDVPDLKILAEKFGVSGIYTSYPRQDGHKRYYTAQRKDGSTVIISDDQDEFTQLLPLVNTKQSVLAEIEDEDGVYFSIEPAERGNREEDCAGQAASGTETVLDDTVFWLNLDGERYFCMSHTSSLGVKITYGLESDAVLANSHLAAITLLSLISVIFTAVAAYAYYSKRDACRIREKEKPKAEQNTGNNSDPDENDQQHIRKLAFFASCGIALICAAAFYVQTLYSLSLQSIQMEQERTAITTNLDCSVHRVDTLRAVYKDRFRQTAQIVSTVLSEKSMQTEENLQHLSDSFGLSYIQMFDAEGRETLSNSSIQGMTFPTDEDSPYAPLFPILQGAPWVVQDESWKDITGEEYLFAAARLEDRDEGFVVLAADVFWMYEVTSEASPERIIDFSIVDTGDEAVLVDIETGTIRYSTTGNGDGIPAEELGITEKQLRAGYTGDLVYDGVRYYAESFEKDGMLVYLLGPSDTIYIGRLSMTILMGVLSLFQLVVLTLYIHKGTIRIAPDGASEYLPVMTGAGDRKLTLNIIARAMQRRTAWFDKTAEEKTACIVSILVGIIGADFFLLYLFYDRLFPANTIFGFLFNHTWNPGLNVFSLTAAGAFLTSSAFLLYFVNRFLSVLIHYISPKNETSVRLLRSF